MRPGLIAPTIAVLALLAGCTGRPSPRPTPGTSSASPASESPTNLGPLGGPGCEPPSPVVNMEVQGTGHGVTLYGLLMLRDDRPYTGQDIKIVWRMTGEGPLRTTATGPAGEAATTAWGPEAHGDSNYERPGDEWGTGWVFPAAGCWHVRAERDVGNADVWLVIAAG